MIILSDKKDCCGCNACVQKCPKHCITMQADSEGFDYPIINKEVCIDCGLCNKVCPVINQNQSRKPIKVYAAKSKREEIRLKSSSGGIFTELAEQTINDGGVVFGARFDEYWNVIHDYTETIEGLAKFRGSKYVQSRIGDNYIYVEQFLKNNREVLFSGTPCQIAGLRRFLNKEYENLLLVDIVCYGVPSPLVWRDYLHNYITPQLNDIHEVSFRNKKTGWNNSSISIAKSTNSFILNEPLANNLYIRGFFNNIYLRPSCHVCSSKKGKSNSDITIADYWGIDNIKPDFNDNKGVSLVMIYSNKGNSLYRNLYIENYQSTYNEALRKNWAIEECAPESKLRSYFWTKYKNKGVKAINMTCNKLEGSTYIDKVIHKLKVILKDNLSQRQLNTLKRLITS